ncbi:hypothetical protein CPAST_c03640 [Clostridium pasteurianum DSM 525 = ATCC 6013]|uniref:Uncharacterized protein n=1 Tax=Clostridium pasteurianum DSM 525 = ATCC 6013 TaxID=1262449 RepID=A0A0H3IZK6_CLOPA|nr:hypothetical protein [Clostridium pasteurianum]AJA46464.1 hypothetical protein CPAST_c03640 [Clostridium pasteurianum DSM 525 = ATCC 6013]AJA50452.1 hypothetical protein CLPA_c03640 [Clostridium pasteurianum DSM 525 = ATCC 6013]AOZ73894.1 hypothetical protein AQ983_01765 [Clostridium pasteurianum DSM 525 = ATCC 6013]AOZ77691.1 hypothetical protein AQ984_01765 [Clostridium pasteurianum]ELP61038.1 hypothetical protein F502_01235 [Clostridium pasteurianum DSM 525 = ATCC 6013]
MSAFLGKIHYLLYNKIQLNEDLLEGILNFAEGKNIPVKDIENRVYEEYGYPERRALEEVIDQGNIHGWLQEKIQSVENRTAAIVTELINKYSINIDDISKIYYENGKKIMKSIDTENFLPKDLFDIIFTYMLEGMPCDMINKPIFESENEFSWETTRCIHKQHWDKVKGDVNNFYILRNAWIKGFLDITEYSYIRSENGNSKITRG